MAKRREEQGRRSTRRRWPCWGIVLGVALAVFVAVIAVLCVFMHNSWGLKGLAFSKKTGFYNDSIGVELKPEGFLITQPVWVEYNTNGDDLNNTSNKYTTAIWLEVPEEGYKLYTITARACKVNDECTEPQVATYVLGKKIDEDVTLDIISINSSQYNLYDYDVGIMVSGRSYDEQSAAGESYIMGNYHNRGKSWMRDAFMTRIGVDGQAIWEQSVQIGISGGTSSEYDVKSIKVSMTDHDGGLSSFRLRSGSQDRNISNMRSSVVDRLAEESGFDGRTGTKRVIVFLNGDYYGIFDMQDTFSEQNLARKFGISEKKNIQRVNGSEIDVFNAFGIEKGDWDNLDVAENRQNLEALVDMDDYLKYYTVLIMVNDTDWPMNNFAAWRYDKNGYSDNKYEDGRVRFLIRDVDIIYYLEDSNVWFDGSNGDTFRALMDDKYRGAGSSFRKVMRSSYYRKQFFDLLRGLMDGPFATENVLKIIDEEAAKIEHQIKLFSTDEEYEEWLEQIDLMKKAAAKRNDQIEKDVRDYFGIDL